MQISENRGVRSKRSKDGQNGKMLILDKEGALRTAGEYEDIYLDPGAYNVG